MVHTHSAESGGNGGIVHAEAVHQVCWCVHAHMKQPHNERHLQLKHFFQKNNKIRERSGLALDEVEDGGNSCCNRSSPCEGIADDATVPATEPGGSRVLPMDGASSWLTFSSFA